MSLKPPSSFEGYGNAAAGGATTRMECKVCWYVYDPAEGDNVWQITPVWSYTIAVGDSDVLIDGYMDWVVDNDTNAKGTYHANLHFNPQIKYDLGKALDWGDKQVYVGVEYDYWSNKYGIEDSANFTTDQNTASAMLKVHF